MGTRRGCRRRRRTGRRASTAGPACDPEPWSRMLSRRVPHFTRRGSIRPGGGMKRRALGRTGIEVSEIGVGAWQLGGPLLLDGKVDGHPDLGRQTVMTLIRRCGELGI